MDKLSLANLETNVSLKPMQRKRTGHSTAICGTFIYAFAGYGANDMENSIECKSVADDNAGWQMLEVSLPSPR